MQCSEIILGKMQNCLDLEKDRLLSFLQVEVSGDTSVYSVERSVICSFLHVQLVR